MEINILYILYKLKERKKKKNMDENTSQSLGVTTNEKVPTTLAPLSPIYFLFFRALLGVLFFSLSQLSL